MVIFHMTSSFKRPNIPRSTRWNCNFSLPFKSLPQSSRDPTSTSKARTKQSLLGVHILAILFHTFQVNNVWVLKLLWPGKPALLV